MEKFETSPFGNFLMFKKEYTPKLVEKLVRENNLNGLRIFDELKPYVIDNFEFLKEYSFLKGLSICSVYGHNYGFLSYMPLLESLIIQNEPEADIDLSNQHELKKLTLHGKKNIKGIEECKKLKDVGLVEWKGEDLSVIKAVTNLEKLVVKISTIKNIDILCTSKYLKYILLANCKRLNSIKGINGLLQIKTAQFDLCPKIQDYAQLNNLPELEILKIIDCKQIPSIKFIKKFPLLKQLWLTGNTDVVDGDMEPAKNLEVFHKHRQHYNIKIVNKKAEETYARNMEKVKRILKGYSGEN